MDEKNEVPPYEVFIGLSPEDQAKIKNNLIKIYENAKNIESPKVILRKAPKTIDDVFNKGEVR